MVIRTHCINLTDDRHRIPLHFRIHKLEYTCIFFGFVNAPAELHRRANHDFCGPTNGRLMILYMDNLPVSSAGICWSTSSTYGVVHNIYARSGYSLVCMCSSSMHVISFPGHFVLAAGFDPDPGEAENCWSFSLPLYTLTEV